MTPLVTRTRTGWLVMSLKTLLPSLGPFASVNSLANHNVRPAAIGLAVKFALLTVIDEPTRLIGCFEPTMPLSLSVRTSDAVRVPVANGVNFTLTTHEAATVRVAVHVFDETAKSPGLSPEIWIPL